MSWYKSQIKYYRFYRIKNIALVFFVIFILIFISYPLIRGFIHLFSLDSIQQTIKRINDYNSLIVSILTFFLVVVTTFYAWVTLKMFREQAEHRKIELRPDIIITVNDPIITIIPERRTTEFSFILSNFGKGTALNTSIEFYIPFEIKPSGEFEYVTSSYRSQNLFFQFGQYENGKKTFTSQVYELKEYTNEFLIISLTYEDVQRNIYNLKQYYNLSRFDAAPVTKSYLRLCKEMLFFTSFRYRNSDIAKQEKMKLLWKTSRF